MLSKESRRHPLCISSQPKLFLGSGFVFPLSPPLLNQNKPERTRSGTFFEPGPQKVNKMNQTKTQQIEIVENLAKEHKKAPRRALEEKILFFFWFIHLSQLFGDANTNQRLSQILSFDIWETLEMVPDLMNRF